MAGSQRTMPAAFSQYGTGAHPFAKMNTTSPDCSSAIRSFGRV